MHSFVVDHPKTTLQVCTTASRASSATAAIVKPFLGQMHESKGQERHFFGSRRHSQDEVGGVVGSALGSAAVVLTPLLPRPPLSLSVPPPPPAAAKLILQDEG